MLDFSPQRLLSVNIKALILSRARHLLLVSNSYITSHSPTKRAKDKGYIDPVETRSHLFHIGGQGRPFQSQIQWITAAFGWICQFEPWDSIVSMISTKSPSASRQAAQCNAVEAPETGRNKGGCTVLVGFRSCELSCQMTVQTTTRDGQTSEKWL